MSRKNTDTSHSDELAPCNPKYKELMKDRKCIEEFEVVEMPDENVKKNPVPSKEKSIYRRTVRRKKVRDFVCVSPELVREMNGLICIPRKAVEDDEDFDFLPCNRTNELAKDIFNKRTSENRKVVSEVSECLQQKSSNTQTQSPTSNKDGTIINTLLSKYSDFSLRNVIGKTSSGEQDHSGEEKKQLSPFGVRSMMKNITGLGDIRVFRSLVEKFHRPEEKGEDSKK